MKFFAIVAVLLVTIDSYGQRGIDTSNAEAMQFYRKGEKQVTTGAVMMIVGGTFTLLGALIGVSEVIGAGTGDTGTGKIIALTGLVTFVGGIPFIVMGSQKKRTARLLSGNSFIELAPGVYYTKQTTIGIALPL